MANIIKLKSSTVAGKVPTINDIAKAEPAANHTDKKLWLRNPATDEIWEVGAGASVTIDTTLADLLTSTSGTLSAADLGSDKIYFWDDSAGRAQGLEIGTGLSISGTTLNANTGTSNYYLNQANYWIPAAAWIPRTTNGCGVDSREIGSTNLQNFDELLFDAATLEYAQALHILPSTYDNSTVTVRVYWTASSGSGDVVWGIQGRALADDDALDIAFGTAQTVTDSLIAANDMHISSATSALTLGGTPAANTPIQFQLYRDATNAADTLAVDARLLGVEITFTPA